jgi:hypothetical protein
MTERSVFSIALKVFGFYCIVTAIWFLERTFLFIGQTSTGAESVRDWLHVNRLWLSGLVAFLLVLLLAIVLLKFPDRISRKLIRSDATIEFGGTGPEAGWYALALSVIGIALLINELTRTMPYIVVYWIWSDDARYSPLAHQLRLYIGFAMRLGLGIYLTFGSRALARFLHKLRTWPTPKSETEAEE